MKISYHFR